MGSFSLWHWLVVLVVVLVVFGAGRLPTAMGDLAKGVKAFRKGMRDPEDGAAVTNGNDTDAKGNGDGRA